MRWNSPSHSPQPSRRCLTHIEHLGPAGTRAAGLLCWARGYCAPPYIKCCSMLSRTTASFCQGGPAGERRPIRRVVPSHGHRGVEAKARQRSGLIMPRWNNTSQVIPAVGFIEPCLPTPATKPPTGPLWLHEIMHDGFRIIARRVNGVVRLQTKQGYQLSGSTRQRAPSCPPTTRSSRGSVCEDAAEAGHILGSGLTT